MADVHPSAAGSLTLLLDKGALYSLTTLPDGAVAKGEHAHSELAALFPLPLHDDFESYAVGRSPRYFTDWDGSFSVEGEADRGLGAAAAGQAQVLRQLVTQRPLHWHCDDVDPITLVGEGLANYEVHARTRARA